MTGIPAIRVEAFNKVREQTATYTVLGALAGLAIAIILMRRTATVLIICAVSACAAFWTTGALGLAGEKISLLTSMLPMLVLMIGLTDAVHLVFEIRRSRALGATPVKATGDAMRHLTKACFLTSLTTAIGFCSLYATETDLVQRFGLACTAGCGITFVAVITVLPALTSTRLGRGVLPPIGMATVEFWITSVLDRLIDLTLRFRWQVVLAGVGLSLWFATLASGLMPENEMSESLPQNARSIVALRTIDRDFGGIMPAMVVAEWPEHVHWQSEELYRVLNKIHRVCDENTATHHPFSIVNVMNSKNDRNLSRVPQSILDSLIHPNARRAVIVNRIKDQGSSSLTASFTQLAVSLDDIERQHPGYRFRLSGFAVLATRSIQTMISDLATSLGLATLAIFATMSIACRSIRIGLICLLPNAFPLLLTAAMLYVFDGTLRFSSVIVFSVCLGIAVNDTIHLVSRFQREMRLSGDVEKSLRNSMSAVGSALIVTTLILIVGLSIPISSDVSASRTFGTLSCLAIASALLADLILLPAMLACFVRGTLSDGSTAA
ncbi:MAG: MMPL family transporter, partial [Planctomycetota bacterium]|nr:MMPL family transporter [Planctomycetota bacterium]